MRRDCSEGFLCVPWIENQDATVLKVGDISCGECGVICQTDAGDLCVAAIDWSA